MEKNKSDVINLHSLTEEEKKEVLENGKYIGMGVFEYEGKRYYFGDLDPLVNDY